MDEKKKTPKRLLLNVSPELHSEIKQRAAFGCMSIRQWLMLAINERRLWEDKYK